MNPRIFIVDDDEQLSAMLDEMLFSAGYHTYAFTDPDLLLQTDINQQDLILLDLNMPEMDGIEVLRALSAKQHQTSIILMSGYDSSVLLSAQRLAQAQNLNVLTNLTKPISMTVLLEQIKKWQVTQAPVDNNKNKVEASISAGDLRRAIDSQQLILHYQPQVNMESGALYGVEALARWRHPERGLLYPDDFIQLAENHGIIGKLTSAVIRKAVTQESQWRQHGLMVKTSVNISADDITTLSLPEQLTELLSANQLEPSLLTLEITESTLMRELVTSLDILTRLRMKGFELSIDDFGTGYSSLSQLHRLPFTELKIDRSFVTEMAKDKEAQAIVETCIMLGHKLDMCIVAEGVETRKVWGMLLDMGCDVAQGYYIAKPMPADSLQEWLTGRDAK